MTTETETGQQPNPGESDDTTEAAKTTAETGTDPAKAQGEGTGGDEPGTEGEDKPTDAGPPEAYADFNLPENFTLDGERKEATLSLFRELGLSQERGQKAIDHFIKTVGEDSAVQQQAMEAAVAQQREAWGNQAKAELGAKYDEEVAMATTAVQATQNPKLLEAFNELGWGNHPELIKTFAFFGRMMRDSPVDGLTQEGSTATEKSTADRLFGSP